MNRPVTRQGRAIRRTESHVFPAAISIEGGPRYTTCRAYERGGRWTVFRWDPAAETARGTRGSGVVAFTGTGEVDGGLVRLTAADGSTAVLSRQAGCGCHHPMKRWQPPT